MCQGQCHGQSVLGDPVAGGAQHPPRGHGPGEHRESSSLLGVPDSATERLELVRSAPSAVEQLEGRCEAKRSQVGHAGDKPGGLDEEGALEWGSQLLEAVSDSSELLRELRCEGQAVRAPVRRHLHRLLPRQGAREQGLGATHVRGLPALQVVPVVREEGLEGEEIEVVPMEP